MYKVYPLERIERADEATGRRVTQITSAHCINHHPFFLIPAYDDEQNYLYFVSHRTGKPQIFAEDRAKRAIVQLTDVEALNEWSVHPCGREVYFVADGCAMRVNADDGKCAVLLSGDELVKIVGGAKVNPGDNPITPGTTAVSACGRYWAIRAVGAQGFSILVYDSVKAQWENEYTGPMVSHMQFCPDDANLLFFAGPLTDRVWLLDRAKKQARRVFQRDASAKQWITHESWIPGRREYSLVDWPKGVLAVNIDTGAVRRVTDFNAWHAISNAAGDMAVADTNFPDEGVFLFDPGAEHSKPVLLCRPQASCMGAHWAGPFPYDDGPIQVYAPQHTHPHPRFTPDGKKVVYTSDASGFAQIFEIDIPEDISFNA